MKAVIFILVLVLSTNTHADYDAGLKAYQRGDFDQAYAEWLSVAMSPESSIPPTVMAETCYALGMLFWIGQGVEQNSTASARWLERAAELGHSGAQTKLGYLYGSGQGVKQSNFEALKWTQMAAEQGNVDAQYNLAVFYRDGDVVPPNTELALKWFREAAKNGDQISRDALADYEEHGWHVSGVTARNSDAISSEPSTGPVELVNQDADSKIDSVPDQDTAVLENTSERDSHPDVGINEQDDESWILSRNPENYTIQVIALLSPDKLESFISENPDWAPFAIYKQVWRGKPLFVLLQGDYADVDQARQAVAEFPGKIQKRKDLWIRKFAMVQGLIGEP